MIFTLEALEARHGDALVLYHGKNNANRSIVVIDGGPHKVYRESLRRRLESLRSDGKDLHIPLMMVSHLDEDHIQGLVDLTDELVSMLNPKNLPDDIQNLPVHKRPKLPYRIDALWYNGFDRILDNADEELKSLAASAASLPAGADDDVRPLSQAIAASVGQGLKLRANIEQLGIGVNDGSTLILAPAKDLLTYAFDPDDLSFYELDSGEPEDGALKFTVLGPTRDQLIKLHERWDKDLKKIIAKENKKKLEAEGADYEDESPFNLSSIVVLAEAGGKSMLLTGDARGDYIIDSAKQAGLLENGVLRVDLLKMPHHGSNYNVEQDFFETFPADHYVVSGDGKYENPSLETFKYLFAARAADDRPFTIYVTNETGTPGPNEAHMKALVAALNDMVGDGDRVTVVYRQPGDPSVVVNLGTEVQLPTVE